MSATWEHRNESEKVPKSVQITINKLPIQDKEDSTTKKNNK